MTNYYQILEVPETASADEIKKAYRKLSKEHHPDRNPAGEERFKQIAEAYDTLKDPDKRGEYDQSLRGGAFQDHFTTFQSFSFGDFEVPQHLHVMKDKIGRAHV